MFESKGYNSRRRRPSWKRRAIAIAMFAAMGLVLFLIISLIIGWFKGCSKSDDTAGASAPQKEVFIATPEMLARDSIIAEKVEKLVRDSRRLDTTILAFSLYDIEAHRFVCEKNGDKALIPASCMKLPTTIAALQLLGTDYKYQTSVQVRGDMVGDTLMGEIRLQASDDPLLISFDSLTLKLRDAGIHALRGQISYDLARLDTLRSHPSTSAWDIPADKLSLLNRGGKHIETRFRSSLTQAGISVKEDGAVASRVGSSSWRTVATFESRLKDVLIPVLVNSSNAKAEAVFYHLDCAEGLITDRRMHWNQKHAVQKFWETELRDAEDLDLTKFSVVDGSGLSKENQLPTRALVSMLLYAWDRPEIRTFLIDEGMATPGNAQRRGSLQGRMSGEAFRDRVFVKTGTITTAAVSSLSGFIHGTDDKWYIFSIINQNCPVAEGRLFQDEFCKIFTKLEP